MKDIKSYILALLCCLFFLSCSNKYNYDIVVYGGTPAGITAAIQSAKMGKKTILIEPSDYIGGIMTQGLGGSDINNQLEFKNGEAIGGLALEFYARVSLHYNRFEQFINERDTINKVWTHEPHVAEKIFKEWLAEFENIDIFYSTALCESDDAIEKENSRILSIKTAEGKIFRAKQFIDASLEGDLLFRSGITTIVGRESNATYGETLNGIRSETTHSQFQVKVDPYNVEGDPSSGLIHTIQDEEFGTAGEGDKRLQAFCFRLCLTDSIENQIPFTKPANYNRSWYEIYSRFEKAGGKFYFPLATLPNRKTDFGAWTELLHNLYGYSHEWPEGSYAKRDSIYRYHLNFTQGLFYFLTNDSSISEEVRKEYSKWGLAKDEFINNNHWPLKIYIRDGRRMVSDYVITEHHTLKYNQKEVPDPVAVAYWPPDVHSVRRIVKNGYTYNEGFVFNAAEWKPFGISYRALIPKKNECINIITPTCPSSSHIGYGAIRLEFTFMALGQAAATAAVLALNQQKPIQEVNYSELKNILTQNKQVLYLNNKERKI